MEIIKTKQNSIYASMESNISIIYLVILNDLWIILGYLILQWILQIVCKLIDNNFVGIQITLFRRMLNAVN